MSAAKARAEAPFVPGMDGSSSFSPRNFSSWCLSHEEEFEKSFCLFFKFEFLHTRFDLSGARIQNRGTVLPLFAAP